MALRIDQRGWSAPAPLASLNDGKTMTGHEVGRSYFSLTHLARYHVVGQGTIWELAPSECVRLVWENGNFTTSGEPRGADPELCTACDGILGVARSLPVGRCRCASKEMERAAS